jgi:hypothetical protein
LPRASHRTPQPSRPRDSPQVLQRRMPTDALASALCRVLRSRHLLARRHSNSARPAAAPRPQRPRCIGAVVCVRRGQNRALECGPGRQRRVYLSEGGQSASSPPPPFCALFHNVSRSRTDSTFAVKSAFPVSRACIMKTSLRRLFYCHRTCSIFNLSKFTSQIPNTAIDK